MAACSPSGLNLTPNASASPAGAAAASIRHAFQSSAAMTESMRSMALDHHPRRSRAKPSGVMVENSSSVNVSDKRTPIAGLVA